MIRRVRDVRAEKQRDELFPEYCAPAKAKVVPSESPRSRAGERIALEASSMLGDL